MFNFSFYLLGLTRTILWSWSRSSVRGSGWSKCLLNKPTLSPSFSSILSIHSSYELQSPEFVKDIPGHSPL